VYEATFEEPPGQVFFEGGSGSRDARRGGTLGSAPRTIYGISSPWARVDCCCRSGRMTISALRSATEPPTSATDWRIRGLRRHASGRRKRRQTEWVAHLPAGRRRTR